MSDIINTTEYTELANAVQVIKGAILQSQQRALAAINQELLALYYGIGRFVSMNTRNKNWGKGFIGAVSEQLKTMKKLWVWLPIRLLLIWMNA